MSSVDFEVAVVGGGVMGSSAAYYLAQAGRKTVLLDQFPLPHTRGSSAGHSRLTRQANYGSEALTPIMEASNQEWRRIEQRASIELIRPSMLMFVGHRYSPTFDSYLKNVQSSLKSGGIKSKILSHPEVNKQIGTTFTSSHKGIVDPSAGILLADKCIEAFQKLFVNNGGVIMDNWPVKSIMPGDIIEIRGGNGKTLRVKSLVLCPGPWIGPIMEDLGLRLPVQVVKVGVCFCKVKDGNTPNFAIVFDKDYNCSREESYYTMPAFEYPGYMKTGVRMGPEVNPTERDKGDISICKEKVQKYIADYLPFLEPTPSIIEGGLYTLTPDDTFFLDRHPLQKNIVFAGGFSSTGFKIAPACGQALARMAIGLEPELDFSSFSYRRFNSSDAKSRL